VPFFNWGPAYLATAQAVAGGTWTQSWDWNAANWADLADLDTTAVGWLNGPGLSEAAAADLADYIGGLGSGQLVAWAGPINLQDGTAYIEDFETATDAQIWYLPQLLEGMEGPSE
jgi:simple sugar transport system substrate-binding protein